MKLLLKNNLTQIHAIDLKGKSGSGFLEVIKVLKKAPPISGISQDFYINAHMMYVDCHVIGLCAAALPM